jgi:DNA polymerase III delta prime subunit
MQSFLIIGKPIEKAKSYAFELCLKNKIDKIDITLVESEKAVGISLVRDIQKRIFLKPFKSDQKAVILKTNNGLTLESQNALLKVLEEPPKNTIIILLVESVESILPTILSRCKVISLNKENVEQKDLAEYEKILLSLQNSGVGDRLRLAQDKSKTKEEALNFIEGLILAAENILQKNPNKEFLKAINLMQTTYTKIKSTNTNLRLAMENMFLNLFVYML